MSPRCTTDAASVESVARLINNENDEFVAADSVAHNNETALKSASSTLEFRSFSEVQADVEPPPVCLAELLLCGLPGLFASTSLTCQVAVADLTLRLCFPSDNHILCVV